MINTYKRKKSKMKVLFNRIQIVIVLAAAVSAVNAIKQKTPDIPTANPFDQPSQVSQSGETSQSGKQGIQTKKIINVPYISQQGLLPTGCELISAMMVLDYYGYKESMTDILEHTPQSSLIQTGRELIGDHPSQKFIGDPHSPNGFGCYAPVITSMMNSFFQKDGVKKAVNMTGTDLGTLIHNYTDSDIPVLLWATINMEEPYPGKSWTINSTGEIFQWIAGEHCLVLVGYDNENYYFNDPYNSNGLKGFEKKLVEKRFQELGKQAVVVNAAYELRD